MLQTAKTIRNGSIQAKQTARSTATVLGNQTNGDMLSTVIKEFIGKDDELSLAGVYEDIYYHDPILGTGVDLQSTIPFSEITLSGASETELEPYYKSIERSHLIRRLPDISVDVLRYGRFLGSLMFQSEDKVFNDIIAYSSKDAVLKQVPLAGYDPLIIIKTPKYIKEFATEDFEYFKAIRETLPDDIVNIFKEDTIELDPTLALFVPRNSGPNSIGISIFKRILPLYLMEKVLLKGTVTEATRRQRAIMHIEVGDGDEWVPTTDDLSSVIDLFQETDNDPISSIVATRSGVSVNEVKSGGDFWKVTDIWAETSEQKYKALGISEMFFSGDYSIERSESAISVYLEQMNTYRNSIANRLLIEKMFPLISATHGFNNSQNASTTANVNLKEFFSHMGKHDKFLIPKVHWSKELKPKYDNQRIEILDTLVEKGFPITWAMYASATGINLTELENDLAEDIEMKKRLYKLMEKMPENPNDEMAKLMIARKISQLNAKTNPLARLDQFSDDEREIRGKTKTGKFKRVNQQIAVAKAKDNLAKTLKNIEDPSRYLNALKRNK